MTKKSCYDITTFGEILIDFTWQGVNEEGQAVFAQNPGELRQTWQLRRQNLVPAQLFLEKQEKICMENF